MSAKLTKEQIVEAMNDDPSLKADVISATKRKTSPIGVEGLGCAVSAKGALSIYGLGRFPVTLYKEQWTRLLPGAAGILSFIGDNNDKLVSKGDK